jgi:KDO2-lipid IV(A) lauroyltransferase
MRFQDFLSTSAVTRFGFAAARYAPRSIGKAVATIGSYGVASSKPDVYWTIKGNLRHILGAEATESELHKITRATLRHAALTYYDFFHVMDRSAEKIEALITIDPQLLIDVNAALANGERGVLGLMTHMSNFDLAGFALGINGLPVYGLSVADPASGFERVNAVRERFGFEIEPISTQSLRKAIRRLRGGGLVATGADRPIADDHIQVEFFGKPSFLPSGPARLAVLTNAQIFLVSCIYDDKTGYRLESTSLFDPIMTGNRQHDIVETTRLLAGLVEDVVRKYPDQWMMFHPLWPTQTQDVAAD